jgi:phosphatidate cytidylyltransferase
MAEKVSTRIVVGVALAVAALTLLGIDHALGTGWGFGFLATAAMAAGALELGRLSAAAGAPSQAWLATATIVVLMFERIAGHELGRPWLVDAETPTVVAFLLLLFFPALGGVPSREKFLGLATTALTFVYIWSLGHFVIELRYFDDELGETTILYALFVAKVPDVFAYFIGRTFGKRKLIPSVSPGKTVAGFFGGILGAVVVTGAFTLWTPLGRILPTARSFPFAIIFALASIAGDLVESVFKRSAAVKDSAQLFPTFGGVLDVIDSIVTSAPVVYYGLHLSKALWGTQP